MRLILLSGFAGFKSGICLLIAPVPVHCFSITFIVVLSKIMLLSINEDFCLLVECNFLFIG